MRPSSGLAERYAQAEQLLAGHRQQLIVGGEIDPNFIVGGDRFWFLEQTASGHRFTAVDPGTASTGPAFDHERLAAALAHASGERVDAGVLPFAGVRFAADGSIDFAAFGRQWRFDGDRCEDAGDAAEWSRLSISPDGRWAVRRVGFDVALIEIATGNERRLTDDGSEDYRYGTHIGSWTFRVERTGDYMLAPLVLWAPDSSRFAVELIDEREVERGYLVETTAARPRLHTFAFALPGADRVSVSSFRVASVADGAVTPVDADPIPSTLAAQLAMGYAKWAPDSSRLELVVRDRFFREVQLVCVDPETGSARTVAAERSETLVEPSESWSERPIARAVEGVGALWFSRRSGYGHLWLVQNEDWTQLTAGSWVVREVMHVDEAVGVVYFTASGREAGRHPYHRYLYRVALGGGEPELLTPEDADHKITFVPSGEFFVDCYSSTVAPPVTLLRRSDGAEILTLGVADISGLEQAGWVAPIPFSVKAADGTTDIFGVLYPPPVADQAEPVPIVDCTYPGPMHGASEFRFGLQPRHCEAIAALGFAVFTIDGRGTPYRSREFVSTSYGDLGFAALLADEAAAVEQLAERYSWVDRDKVGVVGVSGGGYSTVRAMLTHPDVFKVGVAIAGNYDNRRLGAGWGEPYLGPVDGDVTAWEQQSNLPLAGKLQGKLLLAWGCMDNNVPHWAALGFVQALIDANKDVDLVVLPNEDHFSYYSDPYFVRRMWDYLVMHLRGEDPLEYQISQHSLQRVF
jgi:dipeptidyl aminopeptidase/acylaminoacyl peptidase